MPSLALAQENLGGMKVLAYQLYMLGGLRILVVHFG